MGAPRWGYVGMLAAAVALAVGCGPIEYVNQVTRKADTSVEAAKAAKADKYSPYYYTLALEYLHKAREEAAAADFQAANRFGRRAEEAANKAKEEALARAGQPIEKFHPNVVPARSDESSAGDPGAGTPAPASDPGRMAPLVDEPVDEGAGTDDELPPDPGEEP